MRVLAVNLCHGGGKRTAALAREILTVSTDTVVLTEFHEDASRNYFRDELRGAGLIHQASSSPPAKANGVFVASKEPFKTILQPEGALPKHVPCWLECDFGSFSIVGVYFPGKLEKLAYWKWFIEQAELYAARRCLFIGDFNTGKHRVDELGATFYGAEYMERMEKFGYVDAWRHLHPNEREYTWWSKKGNPFRLDYAFLSKDLRETLRSASHLQDFRRPGLSDHAGLVVHLNVNAARDAQSDST